MLRNLHEDCILIIFVCIHQLAFEMLNLNVCALHEALGMGYNHKD